MISEGFGYAAILSKPLLVPGLRNLGFEGFLGFLSAYYTGYYQGPLTGLSLVFGVCRSL